MKIRQAEKLFNYEKRERYHNASYELMQDYHILSAKKESVKDEKEKIEVSAKLEVVEKVLKTLGFEFYDEKANTLNFTNGLLLRN